MARLKAGFAKRSTACVIALFAGALACATPAAADDDADDAFLAGLDRGGITMFDDDDAIATAHAVCSSIETNPNVSMLAIKLTKQTPMTAKQSGYFIGLSVASYCPEFRDDVDPSMGWLIPPPIL
ncbi:DUF732 domain-containing protein [Mycobacterium timonense]|jgi:hypothetical protein|uniref:DUF732 domain-containing protein n=1 Tax=Mycobacterium timonense TaxID=701043 RepID=A0A7I9Z702_9MYCO|nr:DUF732 domain-containing protein [Mycobacterium timonense]GFG96750.1 hypothetical protein MTIM_26290 [Mycobacterium timonense]